MENAPKSDRKSKQDYVPPELINYGTVEAITQELAGNNGDAFDGSFPPV